MEAKIEIKYGFLNRDIIKYIAMAAMFLNHISILFMKSGTFISEVFLDIGYFTAITMCYFLAEGFYHTRSKKRYLYRLMLFALISQIPYCLAFTYDGILEFCGFNMIFTLFICFCILLAYERLSDKALRRAVILALTLLSLISDWSLLAPIFTILFVWAKGSEDKTKIAFAVSMMLFGILNFAEKTVNFPVGISILYAFISMIGIALAGITIIYFYNGKRMEKGRRFSKWFFYWFYPVHLMMLGIIRIMML